MENKTDLADIQARLKSWFEKKMPAGWEIVDWMDLPEELQGGSKPEPGIIGTINGLKYRAVTP